MRGEHNLKKVVASSKCAQLLDHLLLRCSLLQPLAGLYLVTNAVQLSASSRECLAMLLKSCMTLILLRCSGLLRSTHDCQQLSLTRYFHFPTKHKIIQRKSNLFRNEAICCLIGALVLETDISCNWDFVARLIIAFDQTSEYPTRMLDGAVFAGGHFGFCMLAVD